MLTGIYLPPSPWPSRLLSKLERANVLAQRYARQGRPQAHIDRLWRAVHPAIFRPVNMGPR